MKIHEGVVKINSHILTAICITTLNPIQNKHRIDIPVKLAIGSLNR